MILYFPQNATADIRPRIPASPRAPPPAKGLPAGAPESRLSRRFASPLPLHRRKEQADENRDNRDDYETGSGERLIPIAIAIAVVSPRVCARIRTGCPTAKPPLA